MSEISIEQIKAAQRAYAKQWRTKNRDKVRANNLRYWAKRAMREAPEAEQTTEGGVNNGTKQAVSEDS